MSVNQLLQVVRDSSLNLKVESLEAYDSIGADNLNCRQLTFIKSPDSYEAISYYNVNQTGSYNTDITSNNARIRLFTQNITLGPLATASFKWYNNLILSGDIIKIYVQSYTGNYASAGRPILVCNGVSNGQVTLEWINLNNNTCSGQMFIYLELVRNI